MAGDPADNQPEQFEGGEMTVSPPAAEAEPVLKAPRPASRAYWLSRLGWAGAGAALGALAAGLLFWHGMRPATHPPMLRFAIDLPQEAPLALSPDPLAFSPDGTRLAYIAQLEQDTQLHVRALEQFAAKQVPGTLGASSPFYSPDGNWIGYFDAKDAKLKKVSTAGGEPVALADAQFGLGAAWGSDGSIIYSPDLFSGLWRIPPEGGKPEQLTQLGEKESTHRWPVILPDGTAVIFTAGMTGSESKMRLAALNLKTGRKKVLLEDASDAAYSPTRHLLFMRRGNLMAVGFDPHLMEVVGTPVVFKPGIEGDRASGAGHFALAGVGALAYATGGEGDEMCTLAWADRQGGLEKLTVNRGAFSYPRLSPDGRRVAVVIRAMDGKSNIWTVEIDSGKFTRLTFEGNNSIPVWTPDGARVTFASDRDGQWNLFWVPADGSGPATMLKRSENPLLPGSWSADGQALAFTEFAPKTGPDLWILSMEGDRSAKPFLRSQHAEWGGEFSPDAKWLAYVSNELGPDQVYVQPFPGPGDRIQISTAEGREPVWGRDGRELFFRYWRGLMSVDIQSERGFNPAPPRLILSGDYEVGDMPIFPNYDVSPDGQRFVLIPRERREKRQIQIDWNCFEELKRICAEMSSNSSR